MSQNCAVFLRKVRPFPIISCWVCLPKNHFRNICNCLDVLSILGLIVILHSLHCHRCAPAFVFPYFIQILPHDGQITCFIMPSSEFPVFKKDICSNNAGVTTLLTPFHQHVLSTLYLVLNNLKPQISLIYLANLRFLPTRFVLYLRNKIAIP